jgi:hypothetical protein
MMENSAWLKMKWRKRLLVIEAPLRLQLRSVNLGVVDRLCQYGHQQQKNQRRSSTVTICVLGIS